MEKQTNLNAEAVYDLQQQLLSLQQAFQQEAHAKNIGLSLSVESELPVAFWDINRLRTHVFNTLLSEAIRNTPTSGKIVITARKLDIYSIIISISDPTLTQSGSDIGFSPRSPKVATESKHLHVLDNAVSCVLDHHGSLGFALSGTGFEIRLPLYELCLQQQAHLRTANHASV